MNLWQSFKDSYLAARAADATLARGEGADYSDSPESDGLRIAELEAALRERDEQIEQNKQLISDLAAEMQRLEEELKISRRSESKGGGDEKYRKLRRFIVKKVHPDQAAGDPKLKAVLESICKEINAEADRIDRA